jgi:phosphoadenosine phosphosulfate reductase
MVQTQWTPEALKEVSQAYEGRSSAELLEWAFDTFESDIVVATGFGPSGVALLHMALQVNPNVRPFYLDTDLLFPETYELRDRLEERLGIRFERVHSGVSLADQAAQHGDKLWERNADLCCHIRKVVPMRNYLADKQAWITAIRRDQTAHRAGTGLIEWDYANRLVKVNPMADWNSKQVWRYIFEHDLPYNPLHDQNYPSLGCIPCTRAIKPGEDERAGRWAGQDKKECGIHLQPLDKVA